jgi:aspartate kinase
MVTTSEVAVSVTIDNDVFLHDIIKELEPFGTIEIDQHQTIISIVGNEIAETKDVMKKMFDAIEKIPVRMVSYGGSHHNVSLLIDGQYKKETLQLLNTGLFGL